MKLQNGIDRLGCGYKIPTSQMQYDATDKDADKKYAEYTLEGIVVQNVVKNKYLGMTITEDLR